MQVYQNQHSAAVTAASFSAATTQVAKLLEAGSFLDVLGIFETCIDPATEHNGVIIDQEAYKRGLIEGVSKVKEVARARPDSAWLSPSSEEELTEVEEALMAGYFGG
ncbi:MAG: hypothetical protein AAGA70_00940 [Pseudomonadota bacterium]